MGSEARTRLGLAAVILVTVLAFGQVYGSSDYPGPLVLAAVLAGGIAVATRRLGIWTFTTCVISAVALYVYLGLLFEASSSIYGFPGPAVAKGLWQALSVGVTKSKVDFAPVPLRAGYLIPSIVGIWIATTVAEVATFRWRRPLLAVFPAIALVSFLLVVGDGSGAPLMAGVMVAALLTFWGFESSHRLRSWGRWASTWEGLKDEEPRAITARVARRMGAVCVVGALAAPLFLPSIDSGLLSWRNGSGNGPGGGAGAGGQIDLLASLRPTIVDQSDQVLFKVSATQASYWKLASLTHFDGQVWTPQVTNLSTLTGGAVNVALAPPVAFRQIQQHVAIDTLRGTFLPAADQPTSVRLTGSSIDPADLRTDRSTGDLEVNNVAIGGLEYDVTSRVPEVSFQLLAQAPVADPGAQYLDAPTLSPAVKALVQTWIAGATDPFQRLLAIQDHLRSDYTYTTNVPRLASSDYLTTFLTKTKAGYCQQFAAAFALLARSLGYPARVEIGFLPGTESKPGTFTVRGTDAHSWPEVDFQGYGWVAFEPTPRAIAPALSYTTPTGAPGGNPATGPTRLNGGAGSHHKHSKTSPRLLAQTAAQNKPLKGGKAASFHEPRWREAFTRVARVLILALIAFFLAIPLLKELKIRRRYARAPSGRALVRAAFAEVEDKASQFVSARDPSESAVAYMQRLAGLRRISSGTAVELARAYEAALYSARDLSAEQVDAARRRARLLRASLWKATPVWERMTKTLSPKGLISPRPRRPRTRRAVAPAISAGR